MLENNGFRQKTANFDGKILQKCLLISLLKL